MKNKKQIVYLLLKNVIILLTGTVVALLLLWLVYQLPVGPMKQHVAQSIPMLQKEFTDSELITGYEGTLTGSFTDCLMLEHAIYETDEHSTLEQMLFMYRGESLTEDAWAPGVSLLDYVENREHPVEVEYSRYWHGYLVVLKPLLALTTVNSIRVLSAALQILLVCAVILLCARRGESILGVGFVASLPFMYFFTMYFSLSLSICFYLLALIILIQLYWHGKLEEKKWYPIVFLVIGMLTSYFDFLTYPLVTLCFPLCIVLYLSEERWQKQLGRMVGYSMEWGIGYIGLWVMKWIITDLLVGGHTIADGLGTLLTRMDSAEQKSRVQGFFHVLKLNLGVYTNWGFLILIVGMVIGTIVFLWTKRKQIQIKKNLQSSIFVFAVALYPMVWFFFMQNHSEEHYMFTFKILSISVFAFVCAVGRLVKKTNEVV